MNLDWHRLKAVVLESDDWGLCAWAPDEQAHRVLADTRVFRSAAGSTYGRSTLESADDVRRLADTLLEFRGGDGFPPVWQANTVMASPDYVQLLPPVFEGDPMPLVDYPDAPSRWRRPGLWGEVTRAREAGVWWPELHGLHHLPESAWLGALRHGALDARRAFEQQSPACEAVQASGEYDPAEPIATRSRNLRLAVEKFTGRFGRPPASLCPPDYRWDTALDPEAESLGLRTFQGKTERGGLSLPFLRRALDRYRFPQLAGPRLYLPPRIAFEPHGPAGHGRVGADAVLRAAHTAWRHGQPAVVSSHRVNYAHLDASWSDAGRAALRDLLARLTGEGAVFLTDAEVHSMVEHGWSLRPIGARGALFRFYGVPREPVRFALPPGVTRARIREGRAAVEDQVEVTDGEALARVNLGEYLLEWGRD